MSLTNKETKTFLIELEPETRFVKIPANSAKNMDMFKKGELIVVEEKIDGTNISCYIGKDNEYNTSGRKYKIYEYYTNGKARNWLLSIEDKIRKYQQATTNNYIFYFEFLSRHYVKYPKEFCDKGYLISVKNRNNNKYVSQDEVYAISEILDIPHAPILYKGEFTTFEDLLVYISQTQLNGCIEGKTSAEGIIIKADDHKTGQKMLKIVGSDFKEVLSYNTEKKDKEIQERQNTLDEISTVVTKARVRKMLFKIMEENNIETNIENLSSAEKETIMKKLGKEIFYDCMSEEPELVKKYDKKFGSFAFLIAKQLALDIFK